MVEGLGVAVQGVQKTGRNIKQAGQGVKEVVKTTRQTVQTAEKATKASAKAAAKAAQVAKAAAKATVKGIQIGTRAIIATVKAIAAVVKAIAAAIAAGGWIVLLVLVAVLAAILIIYYIFNSASSIFFVDNEEDGIVRSYLTIQQMEDKLQDEYNRTIDALVVDEDRMEIHGQAADWKEVVAVYAVMAQFEYQNIAQIEGEKESLMRKIFWDMTIINARVETRPEIIEEIAQDEHGNPVITEREVGREWYIITIERKTALEIADEYGFSVSEKADLIKLLDENNKELWDPLL